MGLSCPPHHFRGHSLNSTPNPTASSWASSQASASHLSWTSNIFSTVGSKQRGAAHQKPPSSPSRLVIHQSAFLHNLQKKKKKKRNLYSPASSRSQRGRRTRVAMPLTTFHSRCPLKKGAPLCHPPVFRSYLPTQQVEGHRRSHHVSDGWGPCQALETFECGVAGRRHSAALQLQPNQLLTISTWQPHGVFRLLKASANDAG